MITFCSALRKNTGLENLVLNQNPITECGLDVLLKAVTVHPTLKFISVEEVIVLPYLIERIHELWEKKRVIVIHGDGYHRFTAHGGVVKLFRHFLRENLSLLEMTLRKQDNGREGVVSVEELKTAFKESGFRLTNKQLDRLLDVSCLLRNGFIEYSGFLDGSFFTDQL